MKVQNHLDNCIRTVTVNVQAGSPPVPFKGTFPLLVPYKHAAKQTWKPGSTTPVSTTRCNVDGQCTLTKSKPIHRLVWNSERLLWVDYPSCLETRFYDLLHVLLWVEWILVLRRDDMRKASKNLLSQLKILPLHFEHSANQPWTMTSTQKPKTWGRPSRSQEEMLEAEGAVQIMEQRKTPHK